MTAGAGTGEIGGPWFELPDELAIDTDVARRVMAEFIRGQLRQAGGVIVGGIRELPGTANKGPNPRVDYAAVNWQAGDGG